MINVDIAFDDRDAGLGNYFRGCKEDLVDFLQFKQDQGHANYTVREIDSPLCNTVYLDLQMPAVNVHNFLFIAYSHGDINYLLANGAAYIDSRTASANVQLFTHSFFYCVACLAGTELGPRLIDSGSHVFIGYRESYDILHSHLNLFTELANIGIKMFLDGSTVEEAFRLAAQLYTQRIDQLVNARDLVCASYLISNRTSLIRLGRGDLTINDFELA